MDPWDVKRSAGFEQLRRPENVSPDKREGVSDGTIIMCLRSQMNHEIGPI